MQQELLAIPACGGISTSRHNVLSNNHQSSSPFSADNSCGRRSREARKCRVPHTVAQALAIYGVLVFVGSSAGGEVNFVAATARPPSARPEVKPALSLARDMTARQVNFRNSPYGAGAGLRMKFSPRALNDLAGRLFPASEDALKKQKFLEVASRIDLSNQVLDLTPAHKIQQVRAAMEKATKRFGRAVAQLRNPLSFPSAVRTAFHSFVNKQQVKAMAELHMENPKLASRLESVDVTPELRHLIASVLPAVQPVKPTADEKAALKNIALFYNDLDATRQRLLTVAMGRVDTTTPVSTSSTHVESSADRPAVMRIKEFVNEVKKEARQRVSDAYQEMSPTEKLDFAAAGLTSAQLTDAVFHKLLENAISNSPEDFGDEKVVKSVLGEVTPKSQTKGEGVAYQKYAKPLTVLTLLSIAAVTAAHVRRVRRNYARRKRATQKRRPKIEEVSLDLNLDDLVSMPLSALKEKAYANSSREPYT